MEVTQFTYQQVGGLEQAVTGEITYGLERLAMFLQDVDSLFDIICETPQGKVTYGDIFHQTKLKCQPTMSMQTQSFYLMHLMNTKTKPCL